MHQHFLLYKPYGYVSQFVCDNPKKKLLGELHTFPKGSMAIGRLDEQSEGLLLLTTDGIMSERIRSAKVEKEYYAQVDGAINEEAIEAMRKGVEIGFDGKRYTTQPCKVTRLEQTPNFPERAKKIRDDRHGPTTWIGITLREGKFRQVRKMTAAAGFPTLRLVRVRIGKWTLEGMELGGFRKVSL